MAFLMVIFALLFISKLPQPGECLDLSQAFFQKIEQRYLKNHVIDKRQAGNEVECVIYCFDNESCVSVNFKISGKLKGLCELNNSTLTDTSGTRNPEYNYLYKVKKKKKDFVPPTFQPHTAQISGFRLDSSILKKTNVSSKAECISSCVKEPCCRSLNYEESSPQAEGSLCEMLHDVIHNTSKQLQENSSYDYIYFDESQKVYNDCIITHTASSCLDFKNKNAGYTDGKYLIDPDGDGQGKPLEVKCDMTSFGGGWTMCYTTDSYVNTKTEHTTTPELGYRADCNNILFTEVMFVDEKSKQKAAFSKDDGSPITFFGNYDKNASIYGLWTANEDGVATTEYKYQMLICDALITKGLFFSGYTNNCYKGCNNWCGDKSSAYFRTSVVSRQDYKGVAFNENGHGPKPNHLISVGIR